MLPDNFSHLSDLFALSFGDMSSTDSDDTVAGEEYAAESPSMLAANSSRSIMWLEATWKRWVQSVSSMDPTFLSMDLDSLFRDYAGVINDYLGKFFVEIRNQNGEPYPPKTLNLLARYMQMKVKDMGLEINLMSDQAYLPFRKFLNEKMIFLTDQGMQKPKRQASAITEEMEEDLWRRGILGDDNPTKLFWTAYFLVGKHFALRSRQEHRDLRAGPNAQIRILGMGADEKIAYQEGVSKNQQGGLNHARFEPKTGEILPTGGQNCPVKLLKKFIGYRPQKAKDFFCQPLKNFHALFPR